MKTAHVSLFRATVGLALGLFIATVACSDSETPSAPDGVQQQDGGGDGGADQRVKPPASISFTLDKKVTVAQPPGAHLAFPSVVRRADGKLLVAYRQGKGHVEATGRIMGQVGSADGLTWKPAEVLLDTADVDDRDPSLAVLASGDVALTYFQYKTASVAGSTLILHHIFYCRSQDQGASFGSCVQVDEGVMDAPGATIDASSKLWVDGQGEPIAVMASSSPVVQVGTRLVLASYGGKTLNLGTLASAPRSRITLYESADEGKTWTPRPVNHDADKTVWQQEPAILPLGGDDWLMQIRTSVQASPGGAGYLAQARSSDGGKTWSAFQNLDFIGHAPDLYRLKNGALLSAYRGLNASYSAASTAFVASVDGGKTWSAPIVVAECGNKECGYPSLLELADDKLLVVYYGAGGAAIEAAVYSFSTP